MVVTYVGSFIDLPTGFSDRMPMKELYYAFRASSIASERWMQQRLCWPAADDVKTGYEKIEEMLKAIVDEHNITGLYIYICIYVSFPMSPAGVPWKVWKPVEATFIGLWNV